MNTEQKEVTGQGNAPVDLDSFNPVKEILEGPNTNIAPHIIGLAKLNLQPKQEAYLIECVARGRTWFVSRKCNYSSYSFATRKRTIQASGETRENVIRTFKGWQGPYAPSIFHVADGRVLWDKE